LRLSTPFYERYWDFELMPYLLDDGTAISGDTFFEFVRERGLRCPDSVVAR